MSLALVKGSFPQKPKLTFVQSHSHLDPVGSRLQNFRINCSLKGPIIYGRPGKVDTAEKRRS